MSRPLFALSKLLQSVESRIVPARCVRSPRRRFASDVPPATAVSNAHEYDELGDDGEEETYYEPVGQAGYARQRLAKPIAKPYSVQLDKPDTSRHVVDVDTLHQFLTSEGCMEPCFVAMPADSHYCKLMVVCSVHNEKHASALAIRFRRLYNRRLRSVRGTAAKYAPLRMNARRGDTSGWTTIDMDDVVVHVMQKSVREKYDLERLWAVGGEYDRLSESALAHCRTDDDATHDFASALNEDDARIMRQWLKQVADRSI